MTSVLGIHHVTAIAGEPQRNLEFYGDLLGLRLVKRTVNFDDPTSYHFYYGDEAGTPGSILTFFPMPGVRRGWQGAGQAALTSFAIAPAALGFWLERLVRRGVPHQGPARRGVGDDAEQVLAFKDPDGLMLEIVSHPGSEARPAWGGALGIAREHALRGFHAVTLWVEDGARSEGVLTDTLGFRHVRDDGATRRFVAGDGGPGTIVDVRSTGDFVRGAGGAGTVHHVAWRVADDAAQLEVRTQVIASGLHPTPVIDRNYFHSVYFREPGGVLFELATDPPGFTVDEAAAHLGEALKLPAQFESQREAIEAALPAIAWPPSPPGVMSAPEADAAVTARALAAFAHRWVPAPQAADPAANVTLLLLHGTGADENDLLPLGRTLLPGAAILSPRGQVLERGAPRFFRRLAEGVFDQEDLAFRTDELAAFLAAAARAYGFERSRVIAVGFSNGANIAASLLLRRPGELRQAVLLSPMLPFEPGPGLRLEGTSVFIGAGSEDPVAPAAQVRRLAELLRGAGAGVEVHWEPGGHTVAAGEVESAKRWIGAWLEAGPRAG